jgi:hypothetical protein
MLLVECYSSLYSLGLAELEIMIFLTQRNKNDENRCHDHVLP